MGYHPRDHPGGRAAVRGRTEDVDSAVGSLIHGPSERGSSRKLGFRQILFSETRMQPRNEPLRAGPSLTSLHINCPLDTSVREKSGGGLTSYCTPGGCPPLLPPPWYASSLTQEKAAGLLTPTAYPFPFPTPYRSRWQNVTPETSLQNAHTERAQGSPSPLRNPAYPVLGNLG